MDLLSKLYGKLTCKKRIYVKIFMFGLDGSGKTSILFKLKNCESNLDLIPTHGFNVENIEYKNATLVVWDLGRRTLMISVKELWSRYFILTNNPEHPFRGLIFVVDSTDVLRLNEAFEELHGVLSESADKIILLVLANKQDLPKALSVSEIKEKLKLTKTNVTWKILGTCAITGKGLSDGIEWFCEQLTLNG